MRSKRKMETVRIRKANATIKKEKVVCFRRKHSHTCNTICRANKIRSKERNEGG